MFIIIYSIISLLYIIYSIQGVIKRYRQIPHGGWGGVQKCQKNSPGGWRRFSWEVRGGKRGGGSPLKEGKRLGSHWNFNGCRTTTAGQQGHNPDMCPSVFPPNKWDAAALDVSS